MARKRSSLGNDTNTSPPKKSKSNGKSDRLSKKCGINLVATEWLDRYNESAADALAQALAFLARASGCQYDVEAGAVVNGETQETLAELQSSVHGGSGECLLVTTKAAKRVAREQFSGFWRALVGTAAARGALFDDYLLDTLIDWLCALSGASARGLRHTATAVALDVVAALDELLLAARALAARGGAASARKAQAGEQREYLEARVLALFKGVFVQRYRDVQTDIRALCLERLGAWMLFDAPLFLADEYLKYLGWSLNDAQPAVRAAALRSLHGVFSDAAHLPHLEVFLSRFRQRFLQMLDDRDAGVAAAAVDLHDALAHVDALPPGAAARLRLLLLDPRKELRAKAARFVHTHELAAAPGGEPRALCALLRALNADAPEPHAVDALWAYLQDLPLEALVALMEAEPAHHPPAFVVPLLTCCARLRAGLPVVPLADALAGGAASSGGRGKKAAAAAAAKTTAVSWDRAPLTAALAPLLPRLLTALRGTRVWGHLPALVALLDLECAREAGDAVDAAVAALWPALAAGFAASAEEWALRAAAKALRHGAVTEFVGREAAEAALRGVWGEAVERAERAWEVRSSGPAAKARQKKARKKMDEKAAAPVEDEGLGLALRRVRVLLESAAAPPAAAASLRALAFDVLEGDDAPARAEAWRVVTSLLSWALVPLATPRADGADAREAEAATVWLEQRQEALAAWERVLEVQHPADSSSSDSPAESPTMASPATIENMRLRALWLRAGLPLLCLRAAPRVRAFEPAKEPALAGLMLREWAECADFFLGLPQQLQQQRQRKANEEGEGEEEEEEDEVGHGQEGADDDDQFADRQQFALLLEPFSLAVLGGALPASGAALVLSMLAHPLSTGDAALLKSFVHQLRDSKALLAQMPALLLEALRWRLAEVHGADADGQEAALSRYRTLVMKMALFAGVRPVKEWRLVWCYLVVQGLDAVFASLDGGEKGLRGWLLLEALDRFVSCLSGDGGAAGARLLALLDGWLEKKGAEVRELVASRARELEDGETPEEDRKVVAEEEIMGPIVKLRKHLVKISEFTGAAATPAPPAAATAQHQENLLEDAERAFGETPAPPKRGRSTRNSRKSFDAEVMDLEAQSTPMKKLNE